MIGIKGVGMTMLAQYFKATGFSVSGSDIREKFMTDEILKKLKIKVFVNFKKNNIPSDVDLIIYSTAYNAERNEEVATALVGKIKTLTYARALAEIFNQKDGIAVVGSHGKTTITAWLGYVLWRAGLDPNVMVGAKVPQFDGAALAGQSDYLIIEADEYQNKLKYFKPKAIILNNIDYDHPDFFKTENDYKNVFAEFIKKISDKGFLVANFDDLIIRKIVKANCKGKIITYAINQTADYIAYDFMAKNNKQYFKVKTFNKKIYGELGNFSIQLFGQHNITNALAVIATSVELDVDLFKIKKFLKEFSGTARRLQVLGEFQGAIIIDDYAHHPTEIKAAIQAIRQKYGLRNLIVVFHPHTFSRTKVLFNDFVKSFTGVDELIILDIYGSAREQQGGVSSKDLVEAIKQKNKKTKKQQEVIYIPELKKCEAYLRKRVKKKDVVALMGAGDVFRVGENLIKK
ncbi:MAG: UDP-N-acetylmuramate--L-alanine ligase [Patescibacteria group bacterium]